MSTSIETTLNDLLNNSESTKTISALLKDLKKDTNKSAENKTLNAESTNSDRIQRKIDIITALIPYLEQQSAEKAEFIIKILTISKLIKELTQNN